MRIVFYAGLPQTDSQKLFRLLTLNSDLFARHGIHIPRQKNYLTLVSRMANESSDREFAPDARDCFIDAIVDQDLPNEEGVVLFHENFFCVPKRAFHRSQIYGTAENKLSTLQDLFVQDNLEVFISLRNPATFIPDLLASTPMNSTADLLQGLHPSQISWATLIQRISSSLPNMTLTVWCDEDSPLIWPQVIRKMGDLGTKEKIQGEFSRLKDAMSAEGIKRLRAYLSLHPELSEAQKQKVICVFLEKYALDACYYSKHDLPGWDMNIIETLTNQYEEDLYRIARMPNVQFLEPEGSGP